MIRKSLTSIIFCFFIQWACNSNAGANNNYWQLPVPLQGSIPKAHNSPAFGLQAQKCGLCHKKIYEQWSDSRHAYAIGPGVLGQLPAFDEETVKDCLNCHAPRAEQHNKWKDDNNSQLHGVDCSACHLRNHVRFGPKTNVLTPHGKVKTLKLFKQSEFCAICHQFGNDGILVNGKPLENTFEEWKASRYAQEGKQCQHCHMPNKHSFKGIHDKMMTRDALAINVERRRGAIYLRATNVGAGHALPTYITPRIRLRIKTVDGKKQIEYLIHRKTKWSSKDGWQEIEDTRLLPDQSVTLQLPVLSSQAAIVEVIVEPDADYHERVYPQLIKDLSEELDKNSIQLLESARDCSGQSIYVLYSYECPIHSNACLETDP